MLLYADISALLAEFFFGTICVSICKLLRFDFKLREWYIVL